jgi:hypothetical protein
VECGLIDDDLAPGQPVAARRTSKWKESEKLTTFFADSSRAGMTRGSAFISRRQSNE